MARKLSDFSQLSSSWFNPTSPKDEVKPTPKMRKRDEADVLAYFGCAPQAETHQKEVVVPKPHPEIEELKRKLQAAEKARQVAENKAEVALQNAQALQQNLTKREQELSSLKQSYADYRNNVEEELERVTAADTRISPVLPEMPAEAPLLTPPKNCTEMFAGETRAIVLATLQEAQEACAQSGRERRAVVLQSILDANPPSKELAKRRAELKKIFKDTGYYTDPKALEKLGFKLISGHSHWKLEYATVRLPIAKTPSDYRAMNNIATDLANRCF